MPLHRAVVRRTNARLKAKRFVSTRTQRLQIKFIVQTANETLYQKSDLNHARQRTTSTTITTKDGFYRRENSA